MRLAEIEEDEEDEMTALEGNKLIRKGRDANTIELVSPCMKGIMKVRGSKIPIASDALRF